MYDLVIQGGSVVDGTGAAPFAADVAIVDGRIAEIRPGIDGEAREVIDAKGHTVTPGFVDVHTHYDGQVTWDSLLEPSSGHGVTTVAVGNCGVGFAPVQPGREQWLVQLMEGVEDIPGTSLFEGITWGWESFPDYLDALDAGRWTMDVATFVPHGPVRGYVMGDRGARNEPATALDIDAMATIVREAIEAGAYGFSTSRTIGHRAADGNPVPGSYASPAELYAIAQAMVAGGGGLFESAPAALEGGFLDQPIDEVRLVAELTRRTGLQATYLLLQNRAESTMWRRQLDATHEENAKGANVLAQVAGRPFGILIGFCSYHPFQRRPTFRRLAASLPGDELLAALLEPAVRDAILAEDDLALDESVRFDGIPEVIVANLDRLYALGDDVDYEPAPEKSIASRAAACGTDALRLVYDACCGDGGRAYLLLPFFGYADGNHDALHEMMTAPDTVLGLADGGAHVRMICDASQPTTMLTHWVRDRTRGPRLDVPTAVKRQTSETAALLGLDDRGVLAVGKRADVNVIDLAGLRLHGPRPVDDLPLGGRRVLQDATGYAATIVAGTVTRRGGIDTGQRPGRLLRRR